ncbi:hypothetical protein SUDANB58_01705 [Streptomyces sp. enrichment culture]|uniref:hypothetical protein n=1 Tax=Streptomyces sp. enrichment culture TaxID=1795815 RepID=UPI003F558AA8
MALKKALACTFSALALAGAAAGTAAAADDGSSGIDNNTQVLSCDAVEVVNVLILSADNNNIDCSKNTKEEEKKEIHIVDDSDKTAKANFFLKKDDYR